MSTEIRAEITGNVWKILVKPGDQVQAGDALLILESMKMEIPVETEDDGIVGSILVQEGQAIDEGTLVARLD